MRRCGDTGVNLRVAKGPGFQKTPFPPPSLCSSNSGLSIMTHGPRHVQHSVLTEFISCSRNGLRLGVWRFPVSLRTASALGVTHPQGEPSKSGGEGAVRRARGPPHTPCTCHGLPAL